MSSKWIKEGVCRRILVLDTSLFIHFDDKYFRTEGVCRTPQNRISTRLSPRFTRLLPCAPLASMIHCMHLELPGPTACTTTRTCPQNKLTRNQLFLPKQFSYFYNGLKIARFLLTNNFLNYNKVHFLTTQNSYLPSKKRFLLSRSRWPHPII